MVGSRLDDAHRGSGEHLAFGMAVGARHGAWTALSTRIALQLGAGWRSTRRTLYASELLPASRPVGAADGSFEPGGLRCECCNRSRGHFGKFLAQQAPMHSARRF